MRLVLDTNVIVSAALWGGLPRQIVEAAYLRHTLCCSLSIIEEMYHVFQYPKFAERLGRLNFSVEEFIERLTERAMVIADPPEETVIASDPDDNKFLACAVACDAYMIVSGDEHLLALKTYQGIAIVSPRAALRMIK